MKNLILILLLFVCSNAQSNKDNMKINKKKVITKKMEIKKDYILDKSDLKALTSLDKKLGYMFKKIGYRKTNIVNYYQFTEFIKYSKNLEPLTKSEIKIFNKIYYMDAKKIGFNGRRTSYDYKNIVSISQLEYVGNGHYLYKGESLNLFHQIYRDTKNHIIITSGFRNILKQFYIFTMRVIKLNGNMSKAKILIAPPAYSYHYLGDFDIGIVGAGRDNFTEKLAKKSIYKKLLSLGYIDVRYKNTKRSSTGVRYEPWHILMK